MTGHFRDENPGKRRGVSDHGCNVDDAADVEPAVADKDPDAGWFSGNIPFWRSLIPRPHTRFGSSHGFHGQARGRTGLNDGFGDVFRAFKGAADVYSRAGRRNRAESAGRGEVVPVQLYSQRSPQGRGLRRSAETRGEHHHVEALRFETAAFFAEVGDAELPGIVAHYAVRPAAHETHPVLLDGALVIELVVLSPGPDVHVKNRRFNIVSESLAGHDRFFDGRHAAETRTVGNVGGVDSAGTHALDPGDSSWRFPVGGADELAARRPGGGQDLLVLEPGQDIWREAP